MVNPLVTTCNTEEDKSDLKKTDKIIWTESQSKDLVLGFSVPTCSIAYGGSFTYSLFLIIWASNR